MLVTAASCYLPFATISVISSACSPRLNCCTSLRMHPRLRPQIGAAAGSPIDIWVMRAKANGISSTYKTRVALEDAYKDGEEMFVGGRYHHFTGLNFWTLRPQSVSAT